MSVKRRVPAPCRIGWRTSARTPLPTFYRLWALSSTLNRNLSSWIHRPPVNNDILPSAVPPLAQLTNDSSTSNVVSRTPKRTTSLVGIPLTSPLPSTLSEKRSTIVEIYTTPPAGNSTGTFADFPFVLTDITRNSLRINASLLGPPSQIHLTRYSFVTSTHPVPRTQALLPRKSLPHPFLLAPLLLSLRISPR